MIAEAITKEVELSTNLIKEGFSHAVKAGELLQEVKSMVLNHEGGLEGWLRENCSEVEWKVALNCLNLFNGKEVSIVATTGAKEVTR